MSHHRKDGENKMEIKCTANQSGNRGGGGGDEKKTMPLSMSGIQAAG